MSKKNAIAQAYCYIACLIAGLVLAGMSASLAKECAGSGASKRCVGYDPCLGTFDEFKEARLNDLAKTRTAGVAVDLPSDATLHSRFDTALQREADSDEKTLRKEFAGDAVWLIASLAALIGHVLWLRRLRGAES